MKIEPVEHSHAAAVHAVELGTAGKVTALMKGSLHTDELLSAVVATASGLRTARAQLAADAGGLRLVAAHTLSDEELAGCRATLARVIGREVALHASVNPAVIAGLELEAPHAIVRNSFRNDLAHLEKELLAHEIHPRVILRPTTGYADRRAVRDWPRERQLIVGDRATGKSSIALDAIVNQKDTNMICVYVAVGQRATAVQRAIDAVRQHGAPQRCVFVVSSASASPGLQWIAPFTGMTIAEYFRDLGQHALVVIDDLTRHAAMHRELALLTREPPDREA